MLPLSILLSSALNLVIYGGSSKLGRGSASAGRGAIPKGSSFPMLPPHCPSAPPTVGRLSLGGLASASNPRSCASGTAASTTAIAAPTMEETFSLVVGNNPLAFAMIIRLASQLVDEIKRVEAQGWTAHIKFDAMANNPSGNVKYERLILIGQIYIVLESDLLRGIKSLKKEKKKKTHLMGWDLTNLDSDPMKCKQTHPKKLLTFLFWLQAYLMYTLVLQLFFVGNFEISHVYGGALLPLSWAYLGPRRNLK